VNVTPSMTDEFLGTRAADIERIKALRSAMAEARQVARAAEQDYQFAQEAFARKYELFAWAILKGYTLRTENGKWRVGGFLELPWDATTAEALLRAWRDEQKRKEQQRRPEVIILDLACLDCPFHCR
jgi:hypothetical protein